MNVRTLGLLTLVVASIFPAFAHAKPRWWEGAVIYEIYPRSFQDSNGDGVGDLPGIVSRLDYLKALGVDAIWLTPIYPSPQVDFGYDVADYTNIDPQFGTLKDFDRLVAEAKKRGIRVLMDMVLNHTSDKHAWFLESMSSKNNPKRNWYVWNSGRPGKDGKRLPPNNWQSLFGHSAWTPAGGTDELYYHFFYKQQPDLNWRNPEVEKAMFDAVRFWLDRGAAGYRFDAIDTLFEVTDLRDAKEGPGLNAYGDPTADFTLQSKQPEVHDVMRRLRALADGYAGDRLFLGEVYTKTTAELVGWYGAKNDELHLTMDMELLPLDVDAASFRKALEAAQTQLNGNMPLFVTDNHDQPRSWDRYGDNANDAAIARAVATMLLGTRSTVLLYYGQELGMVTTPPTRVEDVKDPIGVTGWPKEKGRDGERTPMQWDATKNAGFTKGTPWLPVPPSAATVNVEAQLADRDSLFGWYKKLIALRRTNAAVREGVTTFLDRDAQHAVVWLRTVKNGAPVVFAVNMKAEPVTLSVSADVAQGRVKGLKALAVSHEALKSATPDAISLPPFGVYIGQIQR